MTGNVTRILAVDDEPSFCELLEEFLTLQGFEVVTENDGNNAVEVFQSFNPHMVLLDIQMPGVSGLDILHEIKVLDKSVGVIMISAFGDADTIKEAQARGADYYLQKPIEFAVLMKKIEDFLVI